MILSALLRPILALAPWIPALTVIVPGTAMAQARPLEFASPTDGPPTWLLQPEAAGTTPGLPSGDDNRGIFHFVGWNVALAGILYGATWLVDSPRHRQGLATTSGVAAGIAAGLILPALDGGLLGMTIAMVTIPLGAILGGVLLYRGTQGASQGRTTQLAGIAAASHVGTAALTGYIMTISF